MSWVAGRNRRERQDWDFARHRLLWQEVAIEAAICSTCNALHGLLELRGLLEFHGLLERRRLLKFLEAAQPLRRMVTALAQLAAQAIGPA